MTEKKRYKLQWGIHKRTMLSRDICNSEFFDTKEDAVKYVEESLENPVWKRFGYVLWYADLVDTETGEEELNIVRPVYLYYV